MPRPVRKLYEGGAVVQLVLSAMRADDAEQVVYLVAEASDGVAAECGGGGRVWG